MNAHISRIVQKILKLWRGSEDSSSSILYNTIVVLSHYMKIDLYDFIILAFTTLLIFTVDIVNPVEPGTAFIYLGLIVLEFLLLGAKRYFWPH